MDPPRQGRVDMISRQTLVRYGVALAVIILAIFSRFLLDPLIGEKFPFITLYLAILFSAWYGGRGPALLATVAGATMAARFLITPRASFAIEHFDDRVGTAVYLTVGSGIALLGGAMAEARRRAVDQFHRLEITLRSIGDAVLTTDAKGKVTSLNTAAEELTGWSTSEAVGRPMTEVFRISNFLTREPVEDPVARVLESGAVVGLANHTVLEARNGTLRPIDDSAAPIKDPSGAIVGVILIFRDVSVRYQAEEMRRRLAAIVESSDDAIYSKDMDGRILTWNAGAERLFGFTAAETIGQSVEVLFPPDRRDEVDLILSSVAQGRATNHFETVRRRKDGSLVTVSVNASPIRNPNGSIAGASVIARDISRQRRAEEQVEQLNRDLERRLEEFQTLLDVVPIGIALADDPECRTIWSNPTLTGWLGLTMGDNASLSAPPSERPSYRVFRDGHELLPEELPLQVTTATGKEVRDERLSIRRPNGGDIELLCYAAPLYDEGNRIRGGIFAGVDVSAMNRAERALRASEARLRATFDNAAVGIAEIGIDGHLLSVNDRLCSALGYSRDELLALTEPEITHPDDRGRNGDLLERMLAGETRFFTMEKRFVRKDGGVIFVHNSSAPVWDASGQCSHIVAIIEDITERKLAEAELAKKDLEIRRQADVTAAITENAGEALFLMDVHGYVTHLNPTAAAMFGWSLADLAGKKLFEAIGHQPDHCPEILSVGAHVRNRESVFYRREGTPITVLCSNAPVTANGEVVGAVLVVSDITERKQMEEELRQRASELAEAARRKDEFLAMLAHELRNPLASISNALEVWPLVENNPAEVDELRALMDRQSRQMIRLIDDLLDVSRITRGRIKLRRDKVDLATAVEGAIESVRPFLDSCKHRLDVDLPDTPIAVDGDVGRLVQIFGNILHNAAKYTPPGGHIAVRINRAGESVVVRIRDNGPGIPREMLAAIFDMFIQVDQTLDRAHGGLGLGLTLVRSLVELHGGTVEAKSAGPGAGSEFVIRLPVAPDSPRSDEPRSEPPPPASLATWRVLVVDDVRALAKTLALMLRSLGQETRIEHDGPSAIQAARDFAPQVIFLDIAMPGMDGYEVARRLREEPAVRNAILVALTGFGQEEDRRKAFEAGFDYHLVKPASIDALQQILATIPFESVRSDDPDSTPALG